MVRSRQRLLSVIVSRDFDWTIIRHDGFETPHCNVIGCDAGGDDAMEEEVGGGREDLFRGDLRKSRKPKGLPAGGDA